MSQSRGGRNQPQIVPSASFEDIIEDVCYFRHLVQGWNETVKKAIQDTKHFAESLDSEQIQEQLMALQQDLRSTNNRLGVVQHIQTESRQDAANFSEHVSNCFDSLYKTQVEIKKQVNDLKNGIHSSNQALIEEIKGHSVQESKNIIQSISPITRELASNKDQMLVIMDSLKGPDGGVEQLVRRFSELNSMFLDNTKVVEHSRKFVSASESMNTCLTTLQDFMKTLKKVQGVAEKQSWDDVVDEMAELRKNSTAVNKRLATFAQSPEVSEDLAVLPRQIKTITKVCSGLEDMALNLPSFTSSMKSISESLNRDTVLQAQELKRSVGVMLSTLSRNEEEIRRNLERLSNPHTIDKLLKDLCDKGAHEIFSRAKEDALASLKAAEESLKNDLQPFLKNVENSIEPIVKDVLQAKEKLEKCHREIKPLVDEIKDLAPIFSQVKKLGIGGIVTTISGILATVAATLAFSPGRPNSSGA